MLRLLLTLALMLTGGSAWAKTLTEFEQHEAEAKRFYQEGHFDQSIAELQAAYRITPKTWILINIGRCHLKANRPSEALDAYNQALKGQLSEAEEQEIDRGFKRATIERDKQRDEAQRAAEKRAAEQRTAATVQEKALLASSSPITPEKKPLYRKAWFWGTLGGIVAAGVIVGLTVGLLTRNNSSVQMVGSVPPPDGVAAF